MEEGNIYIYLQCTGLMLNFNIPIWNTLETYIRVSLMTALTTSTNTQITDSDGRDHRNTLKQTKAWTTQVKLLWIWKWQYQQYEDYSTFAYTNGRAFSYNYQWKWNQQTVTRSKLRMTQSCILGKNYADLQKRPNIIWFVDAEFKNIHKNDPSRCFFFTKQQCK